METTEAVSSYGVEKRVEKHECQRSAPFAREKPKVNRKRNLQICGAGRKSRKRPKLVVGKKPNGKCQMNIGVNATKDAVFFAETHGCGQQFVVASIRRIKFQLQAANDLNDLLHNISTVLDHDVQDAPVSVAILKCSGGQYGSSVEAIKAEAIAELAAVQKGLTVTGVAPQSLKKALGCIAGQKWQDRSKQIFNVDGQHSYWAQGANGAVAAAFKASIM